MTTHFIYSYADTLTALGTSTQPTALYQPQLQVVNNALWQDLQLPNDWQDNYVMCQQLFSSDSALTKKSFAQKYGGHQFGQYNPMLGDGRGLLLAEVMDKHGHKYDLHLKGAGPTPYSRHADGRAVLRSTIREYLASEYLHTIGIPSSRSLCLFSSNEPVYRETQERAALMIRTAPSHIRFGHFEYYHHSDMLEELEALFDYVFTHYFVEEAKAENPHLAFLHSVTQSTATLIAKWQAYGFNHGVMNTDNMSIHGITFDYGPYAFFDDFDANYICNKSDYNGRYQYSAQPSIGLWNLNALGQVFKRYASVDEIKDVLSTYESTFINEYYRVMSMRLGLRDDAGARECINTFMTLMQSPARDYHQTFRAIAEASTLAEVKALRNDFVDITRFDNWFAQYEQQLQLQSLDFEELSLQEVNPAIMLRNHHLQRVIEAAEEGDWSLFHAYSDALNNPFLPTPEQLHWSTPPAEDKKAVKLSCSS